MSSVDQNAIRRRGTGVTASDPARVTPGYILLAPLTSNAVILIDIHGSEIRRWTLPYRNGRHARLLPNGNLAVNSIDPASPRPFWFFHKYGGGIMSELDPASGTLLREFRDPLAHHDAYHYGDGSGRILYTSLEKLDHAASRAVPGGIPNTEAPGGHVYADVIKSTRTATSSSSGAPASTSIRASFPCSSIPASTGPSSTASILSATATSSARSAACPP